MLQSKICKPHTAMMTIASAKDLGSGMHYAPVVEHNYISIPGLENHGVVRIAKCLS
jgi:hypothetical protein